MTEETLKKCFNAVNFYTIYDAKTGKIFETSKDFSYLVEKYLMNEKDSLPVKTFLLN